MLRIPRNILLICVGALVAAAAIYGTWRWLGWYIAPETATDRKDHVQVMAVGLGAVGAIITAIIGWRNLKQSQRSTETTLATSRAIEEMRSQNDALQKYLEQMGQLLKEGLRSSEDPSDDVRILARSQTHRNNAFVSLDGADLRGADLWRADLEDADLRRANLRWANLEGAKSLTQEQIDGANGDEDSKLPGHLQRPAHLSEGDE